MATVEDDEQAAESDQSRLSATGLRHEYSIDRVVLAVGAVVVLALLLRLFALGARIAHWDEARVGWWILDYIKTGNYEYRPIIHGPFYHHVNKFLWGVLGVNDATMRLAPAILGGLLPLSALGLRHRLRDSEVIGLALFLAMNPLLLYYSRFMRGDPIVGFFMFAAFVSFVRFIDVETTRGGYLFVGVTFTALAFTAKENAILYLVTWIGATVLLVDHRLAFASERDQEWTTLLRGYVRTTIGKLWKWLPYLLFAAVWFVIIIIFFYAPRSGDPNELGLYNALYALPDELFSGQSGSLMLVDVINEATIGSWQEFWGLWVDGGHQDHPYLPFLGDFVESMGYGALSLSVLAVVGFLAERYSDGDQREIVAFAFYWGLASVFGYPIVTDIKAPWAAIHAVLPLAIPAAVGLATIFRMGRNAVVHDRGLEVAISIFFILIIVGQVAGAGLWAVYLEPQSDENKVVQYAQPGGDLRPVLEEMKAASAENEQTDILLYGEFFVDGTSNATRTPACAKWFNTLPLPWYFEIHDSNVTCAENATELSQQAQSQPPVIITRKDDTDAVENAFPNYVTRTYELRTYGTETVFFIHPNHTKQQI